MSNEKKDIPQFLKNAKVNKCCKGDVTPPISKEKMDGCYKPNGETYPLCKGEKGNKDCAECNVYEDMKEPCDDL